MVITMKEAVNHQKWADVLSEIRKNVSEVSYKTWIVPIKPLYKDDDSKLLALACTDLFKANLIKTRYLSVIEDAITQVFGKNYSVIISHNSEDDIEKKVDEIKGKGEKVLIPQSEDSFREEYYLNPNYTFDNFIVGSNNNYAQAVSLAVAESPADAYNPLFIYGGSGLGKTHLMHAIGNYIMTHQPEKKVLYVSSDMFTDELLSAMHDPLNKNRRLSYFKQKYRGVDVLLIDDIQFIEGKDSTQEEFFHTFNTLYEFRKQIVISSDRHPSKLTTLDERLKSRLQWNIVADIQPPDFETRVAILRKKAEQESLVLDDDLKQLIDLLAEKIKFNVRDLESALTRAASFYHVFINKNLEDPEKYPKPKLDVAFAKKNLPDIFNTKDNTITSEKIKNVVCKKYNIKLADMDSSKRKREFSHPRQVAMYLCREMTDLSLPQIGKAFGGKDHTTVLHACKKIEDEIKTSSLLAEEVNIIKEELS